METKQMTDGKTSQEFKEAWNNHVDNFERLRFSLDEKHWEKLDSVLAELKQLVENATVKFAFKKANRELEEVAN